jgi:hypothetical protein
MSESHNPNRRNVANAMEPPLLFPSKAPRQYGLPVAIHPLLKVPKTPMSVNRVEAQMSAPGFDPPHITNNGLHSRVNYLPVTGLYPGKQNFAFKLATQTQRATDTDDMLNITAANHMLRSGNIAGAETIIGRPVSTQEVSQGYIGRPSTGHSVTENKSVLQNQSFMQTLKSYMINAEVALGRKMTREEIDKMAKNLLGNGGTIPPSLQSALMTVYPATTSNQSLVVNGREIVNGRLGTNVGSSTHTVPTNQNFLAYPADPDPAVNIPGLDMPVPQSLVLASNAAYPPPQAPPMDYQRIYPDLSQSSAPDMIPQAPQQGPSLDASLADIRMGRTQPLRPVGNRTRTERRPELGFTAADIRSGRSNLRPAQNVAPREHRVDGLLDVTPSMIQDRRSGLNVVPVEARQRPQDFRSDFVREVDEVRVKRESEEARKMRLDQFKNLDELVARRSQAALGTRSNPILVNDNSNVPALSTESRMDFDAVPISNPNGTTGTNNENSAANPDAPAAPPALFPTNNADRPSSFNVPTEGRSVPTSRTNRVGTLPTAGTRHVANPSQGTATGAPQGNPAPPPPPSDPSPPSPPSGGPSSSFDGDPLGLPSVNPTPPEGTTSSPRAPVPASQNSLPPEVDSDPTLNSSVVQHQQNKQDGRDMIDLTGPEGSSADNPMDLSASDPTDLSNAPDQSMTSAEPTVDLMTVDDAVGNLSREQNAQVASAALPPRVQDDPQANHQRLIIEDDQMGLGVRYAGSKRVLGNAYDETIVDPRPTQMQKSGPTNRQYERLLAEQAQLLQQSPTTVSAPPVAAPRVSSNAPDVSAPASNPVVSAHVPISSVPSGGAIAPPMEQRAPISIVPQAGPVRQVPVSKGPTLRSGTQYQNDLDQRLDESKEDLAMDLPNLQDEQDIQTESTMTGPAREFVQKNQERIRSMHKGSVESIENLRGLTQDIINLESGSNMQSKRRELYKEAIYYLNYLVNDFDKNIKDLESSNPKLQRSAFELQNAVSKEDLVKITTALKHFKKSRLSEDKMNDYLSVVRSLYTSPLFSSGAPPMYNRVPQTSSNVSSSSTTSSNSSGWERPLPPAERRVTSRTPVVPPPDPIPHLSSTTATNATSSSSGWEGPLRPPSPRLSSQTISPQKIQAQVREQLRNVSGSGPLEVHVEVPAEMTAAEVRQTRQIVREVVQEERKEESARPRAPEPTPNPRSTRSGRQYGRGLMTDIPTTKAQFARMLMIAIGVGKANTAGDHSEIYQDRMRNLIAYGLSKGWIDDQMYERIAEAYDLD